MDMIQLLLLEKLSRATYIMGILVVEISRLLMNDNGHRRSPISFKFFQKRYGTA
jgi:hypothetical protein